MNQVGSVPKSCFTCLSFSFSRTTNSFYYLSWLLGPVYNFIRFSFIRPIHIYYSTCECEIVNRPSLFRFRPGPARYLVIYKRSSSLPGPARCRLKCSAFCCILNLSLSQPRSILRGSMLHRYACLRCLVASQQKLRYFLFRNRKCFCYVSKIAW